MSCHVMSRHVLSCCVLSCRVLSCPVLSGPVLSCHVVSCDVVSCRVLSYCRVASSVRIPYVRFRPFPTFPGNFGILNFPENLGAEYGDRQAPKFPEFLGPTTPPSAHKIEPVPTFRFIE